MTATEFEHLRQLLEGHTPRQVLRYLDYGRRLKEGEVGEEFYQWLGRILHDSDQVYDGTDRALAYEIGVAQALAQEWDQLTAAAPEAVVVAGPVDKIVLFGHLLLGDYSLGQRAALLAELERRYRKTVRLWRQVAQAHSQPLDGKESALRPLLERFARGLAAHYEPNLPREESAEWRQQLETLEQDLEFAEDRAQRAHSRLRQAESQAQKLSRQVRENRENGEKLRQERSRRIKGERQAAQIRQELEQLQQEYRKLEIRFGQEGSRAERGGELLDLGALRRLEPKQFLGAASPEGIAQARRQLAAVFHPDRVKQLPLWVGALFEQILGLVNEACDRAGANPEQKEK